MKTASAVPNSPPIAFVTGRRRTSRSAAITSDSPTATATGPRPVSTIARRSRSSSSGFGGGGAESSGLGGRKHQVVEELRREPALEQPAVDLLEREIALVG